MTNASPISAAPPPEAAATTGTELDPKQIAMLRGLRKGTLLPQLLRTYRDQFPLQLADMTDAADKGDVARLNGIAHSLKSASFSVGATRIGDLCTVLETAARRGDCSDGPTHCAAMAAAWDTLRLELEGYLPS